MSEEPNTGRLAHPLTQAAVDAANKLYACVEHWAREDRILRRLAECFPSNTCLDHVLPKAIILNTLYATAVLAIEAMAEHIVDVLTTAGGRFDLDTVEEIAALRGLGPEKDKKRCCLSFASKYAHLFVDEQQFPILDSHAQRALLWHLGKANAPALRVAHRDYATYVNQANALLEWAGISCGYTQLDHYLWLCGQRLAPGPDGKAPNKEAADLFGRANEPGVASLMATAFAGLQIA
jgi:hypothetical protein